MVPTTFARPPPPPSPPACRHLFAITVAGTLYGQPVTDGDGNDGPLYLATPPLTFLPCHTGIFLVLCVFFPPRGDIVHWKKNGHNSGHNQPTKVFSRGVPVTHELTVDAWKDVPMEGASAPGTPPVHLSSAYLCPHMWPIC